MTPLIRLIITSILSIFLFISCISPNEKEEFIFFESDKEITITRFSELGNPDATSLILPAKINGLPVKTIGTGAFKYARTISLTIPDSVTTIGDWAFLQNRKLTSVVIPDSVTTIGKLAFSECLSLEYIELPDSITSLGEYAFSDSKALISMTIPDSVSEISDYTFLRCKSLTSVTIPESVTMIGNLVFYHCTSLNSIEIPISVTEIGYRALYGCNDLKSIYIMNPTPPILGIEALINNDAGRKIYVPASAVDTYKKADGWLAYADDIESQ